MFLPFWINVIFVISESAKTQWPTRNKNKIPRIFLSGNFIKEKSGQLTVSEVQLSSSSPLKRAVYSLLVQQPGKSFDTEQVRARTLSKRLFLYKHVYLVVYDLTRLSKLERVTTDWIYSYWIEVYFSTWVMLGEVVSLSFIINSLISVNLWNR